MSAPTGTTSGMPGPGSDPAAALSGVAPALKSLREATSLPRLFSHATRALCDDMGFGRAALFSLGDRALVAESVHVRGAPGEGTRLLNRLAGAPTPLGPSLHESEVLRRRTRRCSSRTRLAIRVHWRPSPARVHTWLRRSSARHKPSRWFTATTALTVRR